jgi:hypothetical protein
VPPAASLTIVSGHGGRSESLSEAFEHRSFARRCVLGEYRPATNLHIRRCRPTASPVTIRSMSFLGRLTSGRNLDTRALRAPRQSEVLRPMVRGDAIERAIQGNDKRAGGPVPQPALMVARLAIASPSQADDIGAHRQQNGDAYGDNDQEEFSHCSASRRPQRKAAGIVLC